MNGHSNLMDFLIAEAGTNKSIPSDMLSAFKMWLENELEILEKRNSCGHFERGMKFELRTLIHEVEIVRDSVLIRASNANEKMESGK